MLQRRGYFISHAGPSLMEREPHETMRQNYIKYCSVLAALDYQKTWCGKVREDEQQPVIPKRVRRKVGTKPTRKKCYDSKQKENSKTSDVGRPYRHGSKALLSKPSSERILKATTKKRKIGYNPYHTYCLTNWDVGNALRVNDT